MVTIEKIREFAEKNPKLLKVRQSTRYPDLSVLKYSHSVFYDNLWNDVLEECRGLVIDNDWNVVIRPFRKIYNRNENGVDLELDTKVTMINKINGFMAGATYVPSLEKVVVSTTGSLDSDFVTLAEKWLKPSIIPWIEKNGHGRTWLFEICDPSDPHIIPELPGAYLIGARYVIAPILGSGARYGNSDMVDEGSLNYDALGMGAKRPHFITNVKFNTVVQLAKLAQHEGYVVRTPELSLKIKTPYYLFAKFLARAGVYKLEGILDGDYNKTIDEEFYPLIEFLKDKRDIIPFMDEQTRLVLIREFYNPK